MPIKLYSWPRDRSLQAFKDWMQGIGYRLNPNVAGAMKFEQWFDNDQWISNWKKFWARVDSASKSRKSSEG